MNRNSPHNSLAAKPRRDAAWIDREYNREKFPAYLAEIESLIAGGERSLARVLYRTLDHIRAHPGAALRKTVIAGVPIELPGAFGLGGIEALVAAELRDACGDDAVAVVELGAGIGRNLFSLWLRGGPRDATYVAYEITEAGRACAARLGGLEPGLDLRVLPFDLTAPDFSGLPGGDGPIVLFTNHAIEQVPTLKPDLYLAISRLGRPVRGIHFEPVGWQISDTGDDAPGSSRAYAETHDYNRNLWDVLCAQRDAGRLTIDDVKRDFACINAENGTSILRWTMP